MFAAVREKTSSPLPPQGEKQRAGIARLFSKEGDESEGMPMRLDTGKEAAHVGQCVELHVDGQGPAGRLHRPRPPQGDPRGILRGPVAHLAEQEEGTYIAAR